MTNREKTNIILIGMPGVGKSTVGVILAKIAGLDFVDSDLVIQKEEGKLLKDIIEEKGTEGFIEVENRINSKLDVKNSVVATGGSVVYGTEAMSHLSEIGYVVYLKQDMEHLKKRLTNIRNRGVVLKDGQTLEELYDERCVLYEKYADIIIDESDMDIEETLYAILDELKKRR